MGILKFRKTLETNLNKNYLILCHHGKEAFEQKQHRKPKTRLLFLGLLLSIYIVYKRLTEHKKSLRQTNPQKKPPSKEDKPPKTLTE